MSEQLHTKSKELLLEPPDRAQELLEAGKVEKLIEPGEAHNADQQAEYARQEINNSLHNSGPNEAIKTLEASDDLIEEGLPNEQSYVGEELRQIVGKRELINLQAKESLPEKTLSKFIHQPVVRITSEAASQTISRPSGLLGGGLLSLVGTSAYYYFSRHLGLQYNYGLSIILFISGFIVGLGVELIVRAVLLTKGYRSNN